MAIPACSAACLELLAPLAGWVLPLAEIPDPVFAAAMAGDGVAIDPVSESLHAPCDGVIALLGDNRHALTLRAGGVDILLHVGIETLKLRGAGFQLRVDDGELVRGGQVLLEFDLDAIVRGAPSAITPVLITGHPAGRIVRRGDARRVAVGEYLYGVEVLNPGPPPVRPTDPPTTRRYRIPFEHGLHARPAAQLAAALADLHGQVSLRARGREADARSVVAMMALGVGQGDVVAVKAAGNDTAAVFSALDALLERLADISPTRAPPVRNAAPAPGARLAGSIAVRGMARGLAAPMLATELPVGPARGDPVTERLQLRQALDEVAKFLERLRDAADRVRRDLLAAHLALLSDPQLWRDAEAALAHGAGAGAAWRGAVRSAVEALRATDDARTAERRADLLDLEGQVLQVLAGGSPGTHLQLPERAIVLAQELLPSQLLSLNASRLAGLCTAEGGVTSHVAILAASMGVPTLVAVGGPVMAIPAGTPLVLDADAGVLLVDPPAAECERLEALLAARREQRALEQAAASQPATLRNGAAVHVYCNLGASAEAAPAVHAGAEGCGLLRTEFLFLGRARPPDEAEQLAEYQAIADALGGRPLTVRTLDAGGDKPVAYLDLPREANPALGLRGLRTSLARPDLLTTQLRAISQVRPAGLCRVLLPMVTDLDDVRAVRAQLMALCQGLGVPVPPLGVMIETPAAAVLADQLAGACDFLSIGSNDLSQYTLAMDRLHPALGGRLDGVHPAVLRLIDRTARAAGAGQVETGVCGNLAGDPEAVPVLIGLGIRELSVSAAQIPKLKAILRTLESGSCAELAQRALTLSNATEVRELVRRWSVEHA